MTDMHTNRAQRRQLEQASKRLPDHMISVPMHEWPSAPLKLKELWRSNRFLVQVFHEPEGIERVSVTVTSIQGNRFADGISWDELQFIKHQIGRGNCCAVEIYPPDADVVNVANMRHLWLLPESPSYMWKSQRKIMS
jgi:hypothetical protein